MSAIYAARGLAHLRRNASTDAVGWAKGIIIHGGGRVGGPTHASAVADALTRLGDANNVMHRAVAANDVAGQTAAQSAQMQALADLAALGAEQAPAVVPTASAAVPAPTVPAPTPGLPSAPPEAKTPLWKYLVGLAAALGIGYAVTEM